MKFTLAAVTLNGYRLPDGARQIPRDGCGAFMSRSGVRRCDGFTVKVNGTSVEVPPLASLRAGSAGGRTMGNGMRRLSQARSSS